MPPVVANDVPVAAPILGVVNDGETKPDPPIAVNAEDAVVDPVPPLVIGNAVVADKVVNAPVDGVVAPIAVLFIDPPAIVDDTLSRILKLFPANANAGRIKINMSIFFMAYSSK